MFHYADAIEGLADLLGDEPALTHAGAHRSWREFESRAARLGRALAEAGLAPGAKVGILLYNSPEYYETLLAALKMRLVPFNINYRYVGAELRYLLENADCEALVYHRSLAGVVAEVVPQMPLVKLAVEVDDGEGEGEGWDRAAPYDALLAATPPAAPIARAAGDLLLMYTGGTTGMPKGVMYDVMPWSTGLTAVYASQVFGINPPPTDLPQLLATARELRAKQIVPVVLPSSPLMHTAGLGNSVPFQLLGGRCVTLPNRSFDPQATWRTVERERVMSMVIVGDAFARPLLEALEQAKARGETIDLSSLKMMISSGVMWSSAVKEQLLEWIDATLFDGVGATEGAMALQVTRRGASGAAATFIPLADTRLFSEDNREIARDSREPGLIAAGGALLPLGYYKDAEKTARTFRVVGGKRYAFIGDWGQWNDDGSLKLLGRGSGCINTGGEKVYPEEVEQAIAAHPDVADCLVLGVDDERFGQRVVALVVPAEAGSPVNRLPELLAELIAGYKRPRSYLQVERIPRLPNGKPDYPAARALLESARP